MFFVVKLRHSRKGGDTMTMADRIKECRLANNLTQEELAEKLGLQKSAIAKYESGRVKNIKRVTIDKMATIFNCSPSYLMGYDNKLTQNNAVLLAEILRDEDPELIKFIETVKNMSAKQRQRLYGYVESLSEREL